MSNSNQKPIQRSDFKIAIVCALQVEYDAVCLLVDEFWDDVDFGRAEGDQNFYTTGNISNHNVAIILLASMGKTSAASAVANMRMSFTAIQLLLLVGICGGVPSGPRGEILLGDVILGDEIKLYDYGKQYPDGFRRSDNFGYATSNFYRGVRGLLSFLQTDRGTQLFEDRIGHHLQHLQEAAHAKAKYAYPGAAEDKLFASEYRHKHYQRAPCICRVCLDDSDPVCDEAIKASCLETDCDTSRIIQRNRITSKQMLEPEMLNDIQRPAVHFGRLASADRVLKSAKDRERLSRELQVIGFEMEAAGFHNELPYIIIKSVCDYADSHKSKTWQPFAAATAASACKSLLERYHQTDQASKEGSRDGEGYRGDQKRPAVCSIPLVRNEQFVGRRTALEELKKMLFHETSLSRAALVGLGGIGKTQVGLQLAHLMKDGQCEEDGEECSVLWISALSIATFEQACADIVRQLPRPRVAKRDDKHIVKDYFSTKAAGRWFLILDNADDHDLIFGPSSAPGGLLQHLPRSDLGCILATTRDRRVAVGFAGSNVVTLSEMDMDEAETFFRHSLVSKDLAGADKVVKSLLEFLERIPLAIAQAAAYMNVNQVTVQELLDLLQSIPRDQINVLSRHFQDSTRYEGSQNAIAKTWLASFDKITQTDPIAAKLLAFISFIEAKCIPRSLLPEGESREEFLHAIGTLRGYGFLTLHHEDLYDMHRLVHIATAVWARERGSNVMNMNLAMEHVALVVRKIPLNHHEDWRAHLPHSLKILQGGLGSDDEYSQHLACQVGIFLMEEGRFRESLALLERLVDCTRLRSDEDLDKLAFQQELATAYRLDNQLQKAISISKHVMGIRERVLGNEHLNTIQSKHALAVAYTDDGKNKEAIEILEGVVAIQQRTLNEDHPDHIASQLLSAQLYSNEGQVKRSISILEHLVAMGDRQFKGDVHHLLSQSELAWLYHQEGQDERAISILENVVVGWEKLTKDHPHHLESQHTLAKLYHSSGQIEKAFSILEHVVGVWDKQSKDHPHHLSSQHTLALLYRQKGQNERAISILEHVVAVWDQQSRGDNPESLSSQHMLALIYSDEGQIERAISLLEHVVAVGDKCSQEDPDHITSQYQLARAYFANLEWEKAVPLLEHVVSKQNKTLRKDTLCIEAEELLMKIKTILEKESTMFAITPLII
ncbi:hypothetical protein V8C35DRAFT_168054 [Trichoderma chlorosporum]